MNGPRSRELALHWRRLALVAMVMKIWDSTSNSEIIVRSIRQKGWTDTAFEVLHIIIISIIIVCILCTFVSAAILA